MKKLILTSVVLFCALVFAWVYRGEQKIERGRQAFERYGCPSCHYAGAAPRLQNVGSKYSQQALARFLQDPEGVYRDRSNRPLNANFQRMPKLKLDPDDVPALVAYLNQLSD